MRLIPLPKRRRINLNNRTLHKRIRAHELVVGRIIHHRDDSRLPRDALGSPGEVARIETESTELGVPATRAHAVDAFGAELGVGRLTTELELALLAVVGALGTSR